MILVGFWAAFALYPVQRAAFDYPKVGVPKDWPHLMAGFKAHWNKNSNFSWAFDCWFLNLFPREKPFVYNAGGWTTLAFIPTLAVMLLGLLAVGRPSAFSVHLTGRSCTALPPCWSSGSCCFGCSVEKSSCAYERVKSLHGDMGIRLQEDLCLNSKELVLSALKGLPVPRVPVGPLVVHFCARVAGYTPRQYTTQAAALAESVIRYYERFRPDAVWLFADTWVSAEVGATDDHQPFGGLGPPLINSAADIDRIPPPTWGGKAAIHSCSRHSRGLLKPLDEMCLLSPASTSTRSLWRRRSWV